MELISLTGKTNQFEKRVSEYRTLETKKSRRTNYLQYRRRFLRYNIQYIFSEEYRIIKW